MKDRGFGVAVRARQTFVINRFAGSRAADAAAVDERIAERERAEAEAAAASAPRSPRLRLRRHQPPSRSSDSAAAIPAAALDARTRCPHATLADYVDDFERDFVAVVARERYVQMIHPWRGNPKGPEHEPALNWQDVGASRSKSGVDDRATPAASDVLLVQAHGGDWMGFRDVESGGRRARYATAAIACGTCSCRTAPTRAASCRRITDESARYNLGDFRRTMNLPNVALSFMRRLDHARYQFKRLADEEVDGRVGARAALRRRRCVRR